MDWVLWDKEDKCNSFGRTERKIDISGSDNCQWGSDVSRVKRKVESTISWGPAVMQTARADTQSYSLWSSMSMVCEAIWALTPDLSSVAQGIDTSLLQALIPAAGKMASMPSPQCQAHKLQGAHMGGFLVQEVPQRQAKCTEVRVAAKVILWFIGAKRYLDLRTTMSSLAYILLMKK